MTDSSFSTEPSGFYFASRMTFFHRHEKFGSFWAGGSGRLAGEAPALVVFSRKFVL
jgi:hypothetical protein